MSKIYDAIKRLEAERNGGKAANGNGHHANGNGNGNGNGHHANGNGNGNGNGHHANGNGNGNGNGHHANGNGNGNGNGHHANGNGNGNGNGHHANGNGNGNGNGHHANGNGNGNGNGHHANGNGNGHNGNGRRGPLAWLLGNGKNGHSTNGYGTNGNGYSTNGGARRPLSFQLGPEVEEAYQRLGTNLLVSPGTDAARMPRLLGITASRHGEGTTTTAAVFSSILAGRRSGRVCVVESNLRSPGFETVFHIRRNGGFAELVEGTQTMAEVAQATEVPNLYAIGCGHTKLGPSALFDAPGLPAALEQLRQQFEYVVFDLPPVNVYSDASILGPRLDAAIIVIEADRTRIPEVERTRRNLDRVGVRLMGSVLNRRRSYIPAFIEEML
jgi:capsular exopolysaccharide synthesis family protein